MAKRDFYDILGVSRTASDEEIRVAHRKLVRKFHPDANKNSPDAEKKFKEVQEAYDTLSDAGKRRQYDQFGHADPRNVPPPGYSSYETAGGYGPGVSEDDFGFDDFTNAPGAGGGGEQFGSIFDQLFGQRGPFGRQRKQRAAREAAEAAANEVEYPVTLTFKQAARGTTLPLTIQRPTGRTEAIEIKVPPGMKHGSRVRIKGKGNPTPTGPGDLFIVVTIKDHDYFRRDNLDVLLDVPISLYEALLGTRLTVPTLDGQVTINIPPGTSSGSKLRIKGEGVQRGAEQGDQLCIIKIIVPKDLDQEDLQAVHILSRKHPISARSDLNHFSS
jgi:curved DNA-binding protein